MSNNMMQSLCDDFEKFSNNFVIVILLSSEEEDHLNAKCKVEEKLQNGYPINNHISNL